MSQQAVAIYRRVGGNSKQTKEITLIEYCAKTHEKQKGYRDSTSRVSIQRIVNSA